MHVYNKHAALTLVEKDMMFLDICVQTTLGNPLINRNLHLEIY